MRTRQDAEILGSKIAATKAAARAAALKAEIAARDRAETLRKLMEHLEKQKTSLMDQISNSAPHLMVVGDDWRQSLADIDLAAAGADAQLMGLLEKIKRRIQLYYPTAADRDWGWLDKAMNIEPSPLFPAKAPEETEKLPRSFIAMEVEQRQREREEAAKPRRERARKELASLEQGLESLISDVAAYDAGRSS
jgi:hypothetical protein